MLRCSILQCSMLRWRDGSILQSGIFGIVGRHEQRTQLPDRSELISSIGVRCVLPRKGAGKACDAASALSGKHPEGAACLGELLRDESGARRPVLTLIRALHFIPNRTRSHSRLLM